MTTAGHLSESRGESTLCAHAGHTCEARELGLGFAVTGQLEERSNAARHAWARREVRVLWDPQNWWLFE